MRLAPGAAHTAVPVQVEGLVNSPRPGETLPDVVRQPLERTFNTDLSEVRVHTEPEAAPVVDSLHARAFTYGTHIYLGQGEKPSDLALMAHEVTHVVQQQGAPVLQLYGESRSDRFEHEAHQAATTAQGGGPTIVKERTGGPKVQTIPIISDVIDWLEDKLWALLERVAPSLVPIFKKGVLNWLKEKLSDAVQSIVDFIARPVRAISDVVSGVRTHFSNLVGWMRDAAARIAKGDCGAISEAADKIYNVFEGLTAPVIERVKYYAGKVKDFFTGLWDRFGAPIWDLLKRIGGAIWDTIERIGRWIWEKTQPVRDWAARAWRWLKNFIGIGEGEEGQNGILQWFQRKASAAWDWVMERIAPFKRQLLIVAGVLVMLSPAGPFIAIGAAAAGILRGIQWLRQHMRSRNSVVQQQSFLRGTILPAILSGINAASGAIGRVAGAITGALTRVVNALAELGSTVGSIPIIGFARGLVDWIAGAFRGPLNWAIEGIQGLAGWVQGGLQRLEGFARRLVDALEEIGRVVGNFLRVAGGVFRRIWNAIPKCIRDPFVDWFIPLILRNIPFFSELASSPEAWQQTKTQVNTLLVQVFVNFDLIGAMKTVFRLVVRVLRIPLDLIGQLLDKASQAWDLVLKKPLQFIENSIKAILRGIGRFMSNILSHLWFGVQGWLLNSIGDRSLTLPSGLTDWRGWLNLILDILGLSVDHVIDLIDRRFPGSGRRLRQALNFLTGALEVIRIALTEGPKGLWRYLMQRLSDLGNAVIGAAVNWAMTRIIAIVSARLTALAASAGLSGVLEAVVAVWQAVRTAIEYATRIIQFFIQVFDMVIQIANGVIDPAAQRLEGALRTAMPIVIGFLANYAGLSGVGDRIREIMTNIRERVDNAILAIIDGVAALIRNVINMIQRGVQAVVDWWRTRKAFRGADGQPHELFFRGSVGSATLMVKSIETPFSDFINRAQPGNDAAKVTAKTEALRIAGLIDGEIRRPEPAPSAAAGGAAGGAPDKASRINELLDQLKVHTAVLFGSAMPDSFRGAVNAGVNGAGFGVSMSVKPLTNKNRPEGSPPTSAANTAYAALNERRSSAGGASYYIKGHLLNEKLGGPGVWVNLTPLSRSGNALHETQAESIVKRAVDLPAIVEYSVVPNYSPRSDKVALLTGINSGPEAADAKRIKVAIVEAEDFVPASLRINAWLLEEGPSTGQFQQKGAIISRTLENPIERSLNSYYLSSTPRPEKINLSTSPPNKIAVFLGPTLAQRLVDARDARERQTGATRWTSYQQIAAAVPGISTEQLSALERAGHVSLF